MSAPEYVLRSYAGGAYTAQLVNSIGASDTSFAVAPTTGWTLDDGSGNPLGTNGPFTIAIDLYTPSVEKILCSAINLTTGIVTVYTSGGWSGRGYDGTSPQAHVPGTSSAGVQPTWSSIEAKEANAAVYDVLGGGSAVSGIPIGGILPFAGTPLSVPTNYLAAIGQSISASTYGACFTALTIATTGTTTSGGATINSVSSSVTPYVIAGQAVTLTNSGGATYTVLSVGSTSITLTSGTGITAGTAGAVVIYPYGCSGGVGNFNLPDTRGRSLTGQGALGTNAQPTLVPGQTSGLQTITLATGQLPSHNHTVGGITVGNQSASHDHTLSLNLVGAGTTEFLTIGGSGYQASQYNSPVTGAQNANHNHALGGNTDSTGSGSSINVESPLIGVTHIIRVQ